MKFSPKLIFYVTFLAACGQGISSGAVHLSGLIPAAYVAPVSGWIALLTFVALAWLSLATGYAGAGTGPLGPPVSRDEVRKLADDAQMAVIPKRDAAPSVQAKP
jgi:hypothetical protein